MKEVRVSVASLIGSINNKKIGIINHSYLKETGESVVSAIGGGCFLKDKKYLREEFFANNFEGEDARFIIPEQKLNSLIEFLSSEKSEEIIDFSIDRELEEELTGLEIETQEKQFISKEDLVDFKIINKFTHLSEGKSYKFLGGNTFRYCIYYNVSCPDSILKKLLNNKEVYELSNEEINLGFTKDGLKINSNIFI